jgi:hypothetical protein
MRILVMLLALAGCAGERQLVQPLYESGPYLYGPVQRKAPPPNSD